MSPIIPASPDEGMAIPFSALTRTGVQRHHLLAIPNDEDIIPPDDCEARCFRRITCACVLFTAVAVISTLIVKFVLNPHRNTGSTQ